MPALFGNIFSGNVNNLAGTPRLRLRDLVTPVNAEGQPDPQPSTAMKHVYAQDWPSETPPPWGLGVSEGSGEDGDDATDPGPSEPAGEGVH